MNDFSLENGLCLMKMNIITGKHTSKFFIQGRYYKRANVVFANQVVFTVDWLSGSNDGGQPYIVIREE